MSFYTVILVDEPEPIAVQRMKITKNPKQNPVSKKEEHQPAEPSMEQQMTTSHHRYSAKRRKNKRH